MSRTTREQVYAALYAKLQGISGLTTVGRKLKNIQDIASESLPAAFQVQEKQSAKYQGSVPTRAVLRASWLFYNYDADDAVAPSTGLNNLVDAACAALAAPSPMQKNTLGGLVEYVAIDGDIEIFEGVLGDRAIAIVPIEMILPGF
jgi:hypothetical protein